MLEQDKQPLSSTRKTKRIWWFIFGTLIFILIGFLLTPAPLVAGLIDSRLPGPVYLENLSGLWWNGTAKLRLMQYKGRSLEFPDFRWRTNPFAVLSEPKQFEMWFNKTQSAPTVVSKNKRRWTATNLEFQAPAQEFLKFQYNSAIRAQGIIDVKLEHAMIQSPYFVDPQEVIGKAVWHDAVMGFLIAKSNSMPAFETPMLPLGEITILFEGKIGLKQGFLEDSLKVSNLGGAVKLNLVMKKGIQSFQANGITIRPEASLLEKLQALGFFGSLKR
jgi:hypothetical protein